MPSTERTPISIVLVAVVALGASGCGSGSVDAGNVDAIVRDLDSLPATVVDAYEYPFDSLADQMAASDAVVVGTVSDYEDIGLIDQQDDPRPSEYVVLTIDVEQVIQGHTPATIGIPWEAFLTDGDGRRTATVSQNGIDIPRIGERLLLYLVNESEGGRALFGPQATHRPINSDGVLIVGDDGTLSTEVTDPTRLANRIAGATVADIVDSDLSLLVDQ
jgi:hypothetical protein